MVQQAQLDYKETFTWGTWWKQFWCQEVVTTSCQHSMNTDSMVATIGKWAIWGNFKVMVYTVREDQHWVIFNSWAGGGGTEWEIWFFSMWNFTREVLMTKDSWKKTEGNLSPHYSSPRNVPLPRRTRVASSWTGGQPLISVSSPVAATPPPPKYLCFVGSVVCPVVLQKHSAGFRIVGTSRKSRLPVWYHLFPVADVPVRRRPNTGLQVMLWAALLLFTSLQQSGLEMVLCSTKVGRCPRLSCMEAWGYFIFSACFPIWSDKGSRHNVLCGVLSTAASRTTFLNISYLPKRDIHLRGGDLITQSQDDIH